MFCIDSGRKGIFVALAIGLGAVAQASDVTLIGTASGTFNNGLTTINGLTYVGSTFDVTTSDGFYALGNNAESPNFDNLGSFTLTGAPDSYIGDTFTLDVTFLGPAGIQGSDQAIYSTTLFGDVTANGVGGVSILFPSTSTDFTFKDGDQTGFFTITVNTLSITPGLTAPATAEGEANVTAPAPPAAGCLASGFIGAAFRRRRRDR